MARIIRNVPSMRKFSSLMKKKGLSIGLIPTMGCLHEGHLSLVREAGRNNDVVVVSVFVNPAQFGPKEDLKKYPRDIKTDIKTLSKCKVDAVFYPDAKEIYPKGFKTYIEVKDLQDKLCGASRPGHFRGVATVVALLFNIVCPDRSYFGLKDFQQQVIIRKMVKDLNMDVDVISLPTLREKDGLAMSSRNTYLDGGQRTKASVLNRSLKLAHQLVKHGERNAPKIMGSIKKTISAYPGIKIDYISVCDPETLEAKSIIKGKTLIAAAIFIGKTRLIDNIVVNGGAGDT